MSKATVLDLIDSYAFDLEGVTVETYYEDATWDMARAGVSTVVTLLPATRTVGEYTLPDVETKLYSLFYDDVLLSVIGLKDLEAVNILWRSLIGRPSSYVIEDESIKRFLLVPIPDQNSTDFVFLFGSPMGHDFPERAVGAVISERRDDLPTWLDVPLALSVLSREYERESDHQDPVFAKACREMGTELLAMVLT